MVVDTVHDELVVGNSNGRHHRVRARPAGTRAPLRAGSPGSSVSGVIVDPVHDEIIAVAGTTVPSIPARPAERRPAPVHRRTRDRTGTSVGVALDLIHDEIFITSTNNDSIRVFSRLANGNVAPLRTIEGAATGLDAPWGIALDLARTTRSWWPDAPTSTVRVFRADGDGQCGARAHAQRRGHGDRGPHGWRSTFSDELIVTNQSNSSVRVQYAASGKWQRRPEASGTRHRARLIAVCGGHDDEPAHRGGRPPDEPVGQIGATATAFAAIMQRRSGPVQHCAPTPITPCRDRTSSRRRIPSEPARRDSQHSPRSSHQAARRTLSSRSIRRAPSARPTSGSVSSATERTPP